MASYGYETPKLAVTTNLSNESFAAMLDRAIARSRAPPKQIEHRPDETAENPRTGATGGLSHGENSDKRHSPANHSE